VSRWVALPDYHPRPDGFQLMALHRYPPLRRPTDFGHTHLILLEADARPGRPRRPVVENRAAHPCSPSNVHPIEPDRLLHLSLHMTPTIFATRGPRAAKPAPMALGWRVGGWRSRAAMKSLKPRKRKAQAASFIEQARFYCSRAVGRTHVQPPN
jgi:hypothetical protein